MWSGAPFRPHESDAPLTAPSGFALSTIARASERQLFDQHMEEKWRAIEVLDNCRHLRDMLLSSWS